MYLLIRCNKTRMVGAHSDLNIVAVHSHTGWSSRSSNSASQTRVQFNCPTATLSCLNSCSKDNGDNVWLSCRMRRLCRVPKFLLKYRPITRLQHIHVQLPTSAVNAALPAFARQQTRRMPLQRSIDGTDGRTPNRYIDSAPRTMRPVRVATFALSQSGAENFWNSICDLVHFEAVWWQLFVGRQTRYICNFAIKIEPNSDPTV